MPCYYNKDNSFIHDDIIYSTICEEIPFLSQFPKKYPRLPGCFQKGFITKICSAVKKCEDWHKLSSHHECQFSHSNGSRIFPLMIPDPLWQAPPDRTNERFVNKHTILKSSEKPPRF